MVAKYIGNIGKNKLHIVEFVDGRCHIDQIRPEQKIAFDSLEEAMSYPDGKGPIFHECGVCFKKMKEVNNNGK